MPANSDLIAAFVSLPELWLLPGSYIRWLFYFNFAAGCWLSSAYSRRSPPASAGNLIAPACRQVTGRRAAVGHNYSWAGTGPRFARRWPGRAFPPGIGLPGRWRGLFRVGLCQ